MKKFLLVISFAFIFINISNAQAISCGKILENQSMPSKILNGPVHYAVYLPPDYQVSERRYPVVYLLHGYSDKEWGWIQFGEIQHAADKAIADGIIPPMIIVMPDGKITWYINDYQGKDRYEDMIFTEFIPYIDATFRTRPEKEFRGVAGLSMGGYGSLIWSLHHPETFAACAALSSGVMTDEEIKNMPADEYRSIFTNRFTSSPSDRLTPHWYKNSVIALFSQLPEDKKRDVRYWIDCGDDDFLYKGNSTLHILLRDLNIPHEYRVRNGGHSWEYWRTGITDALKFIGESFHR
ncbi:MAG TPA: alpha/beta hydrolase-fold protein [Bacteroidales bacterium]|nr:alpha/beta hydrolase-fold protein [Bacteroidales bacterium]